MKYTPKALDDSKAVTRDATDDGGGEDGAPVSDSSGSSSRERMDWMEALLKDAQRLNFESTVKRVGRSSGMILLPGQWIGRRVKVNVELLD